MGMGMGVGLILGLYSKWVFAKAVTDEVDRHTHI